MCVWPKSGQFTPLFFLWTSFFIVFFGANWSNHLHLKLSSPSSPIFFIIVTYSSSSRRLSRHPCCLHCCQRLSLPLSPSAIFRRRCTIEGDDQLLLSSQSCSASSPALLRAPSLLCVNSIIPAPHLLLVVISISPLSLLDRHHHRSSGHHLHRFFSSPPASFFYLCCCVCC